MPKPRFAVDEMLGSLAKWLRIMGYDTSYQKDMTDTKILESSQREGRFLLTRDKELAMRAGKIGLLIESDDIDQQLRQVVSTFHLSFDESQTRCSVCNSELRTVEPREVEKEVPPGVLERNEEFFRCEGCGRIYWKGTHWSNIRSHLNEVDAEPKAGSNPR